MSVAGPETNRWTAVPDTPIGDKPSSGPPGTQSVTPLAERLSCAYAGRPFAKEATVLKKIVEFLTLKWLWDRR